MKMTKKNANGAEVDDRAEGRREKTIQQEPPTQTDIIR